MASVIAPVAQLSVSASVPNAGINLDVGALYTVNAGTGRQYLNALNVGILATAATASGGITVFADSGLTTVLFRAVFPALAINGAFNYTISGLFLPSLPGNGLVLTVDAPGGSCVTQATVIFTPSTQIG